MAKRIISGLVFLIAILAYGCGQSDRYADLPTRRGEVTPSGIKLGGVLRLNEEAAPRSLDPVLISEDAGHHVGDQIYESLLEFDDRLNLIPGLAERYEISEDGKVYTFYLRKGVVFHDNPCFPSGKGREMLAGDVKYTFSRVLHPGSRSTGVWVFEDIVEGARDYLNGKAEEITGFQVLDDYTFQVRLVRPFSPFKYRLAMAYCFIHPREAVEYYGAEYFQNPVGTGPFQFVYWKPNQEILLKRNLHYWMRDRDGVQLPYLDGVSFGQIPDFKVAFIELDMGNLDSIRDIHDELWTKVFDENRQPQPGYEKYQIQSLPLWVTQYYGFNLTKPPFQNNLKLRQALNYALDREAIIKYVINGRGTPARGVVPEGMPGYHSQVDGYPYDPDLARRLLAEAGYPNGEGLEEITLQLNSGGTINETIAEAVQDQLGKIGVKIRLQIVEWAQHLQSVDDGQPVFYRLGWVADYPDPENFLSLLWSRNFSPNGPNYSRYSNSEYDRLFEEALLVTDPVRQMELYQQAERIAVEEAPWLFLYYTVRYRLLQPYVRNLVFNPQELVFCTHVWLDTRPGETVEKAD